MFTNAYSVLQYFGGNSLWELVPELITKPEYLYAQVLLKKTSKQPEIIIVRKKNQNLDKSINLKKSARYSFMKWGSYKLIKLKHL